MTHKRLIMITGQVGLAAAILVGIGEFLLHYDQLARYTDTFAFFEGVTRERATIGHFFGVFGAPLYVVGAVHIYLMLRPAHEVAARVAGLMMGFACIVGAVWIGSRALYELRYESLLQIVRLGVLALSVIFIWLCLTGRSYYPRAMAILNPIFLIVMFSVSLRVASKLKLEG